jgi:hypothetical protein
MNYLFQIIDMLLYVSRILNLDSRILHARVCDHMIARERYCTCMLYLKVILRAPNFAASVLAVALRNNKSVFGGETGFAADCIRFEFFPWIFREHNIDYENGLVSPIDVDTCHGGAVMQTWLALSKLL